MSEEKFLFKDIINKDIITELAANLKKCYSDFKAEEFIEFVTSSLPSQEFKERIVQVTIGLEKYLPSDFPTAINILNESLGDELPDRDILGEKNYESFYITSFGEFVSRNGSNYFDLSMDALYEQTKRLTSEFSIRIFLENYETETLEVLKRWAKDSNQHVRRLVSEGSRPRLPWGLMLKSFVKNPDPILKLLELLKNDESSYVRRSVANSLNDISKDHPHKVIFALRSWKNGTKEMSQLTRHALRTLIKEGNQDALALCGFDDGDKLELEEFSLKSDNVQFGKELEFEIKLKSNKELTSNIMIDYAIHYMKANKKLSRKIYKLSKKKLEPSTAIIINGKRNFKEISTRKFYSGIHKIEIICNGKSLGIKEFTLIK
ncbi:DNA alkylation repair protein [Candidatus Kapabacteria bacterium]|nr:DNA alkylation repair protein [Candidatus Kapabacteria bacterium]